MPESANESNTIDLSGDSVVGEDNMPSAVASSSSSSDRAQSNVPVKSLRAQSTDQLPNRGDIQVMPVRYWEDALRQQRRETPMQWAERILVGYNDVIHPLLIQIDYDL